MYIDPSPPIVATYPDLEMSASLTHPPQGITFGEHSQYNSCLTFSQA